MDYNIKCRYLSTMKYNHGKSQSLCSHSPFVGWLISVQVLITARGRGCIFNPFCRSVKIYLSRNNRRRQEEGKYGQESASFNETVMSGGVSDKKEKNQRVSLLRAWPAAPPGDIWWYRLLSATFLTGLRQALMNKQIYCIVIGTSSSREVARNCG